MRNVLIAPVNIASMADTTLVELNKSKTIHAKGICYSTHKYCNYSPYWRRYNIDKQTNFFTKYATYVAYKLHCIYLILWADVVIWYWHIDWLSSLLIRVFNKKIIVEFVGSDIRLPELVSLHNPYFKKAVQSGEYNLTIESAANSDSIQNKFAKCNAIVLVNPEMQLFINPNIFPKYITFFQQLNLEKYNIRYPTIDTKKPVIVHAPSHLGCKGTKYVRECVQQLQLQNFEFSYVEIHNKTKQQSQEAIEQCDIFIDQLICGSYGLASCEAMAMGKPTLCYIMPIVAAAMPASLPIVSVTVDNLYQTVARLLADAQERGRIGIKSREYIEQYHDVKVLSKQLINIINAS